MKDNNYKCKICGSKINKYDFYSTIDKKEFFCSEKCCEDNYYNTEYDNYIYISTCGGYFDCKKLDNVYDMCRIVRKIQFPKRILDNLNIPPKRCPPAEISIIRTNMKLYDFIKTSEKQSSELNNETLKLTKSNVKLAKAMLALSTINVVGIIIQICLQ